MWSINRPAMWCHAIGFFSAFSLFLKNWKSSIDFRQGIILTRESQSTYILHLLYIYTLILHACKMLAYHGQKNHPDSIQMKTCTWMAQKLLGWGFYYVHGRLFHPSDFIDWRPCNAASTPCDSFTPSYTHIFRSIISNAGFSEMKRYHYSNAFLWPDSTMIRLGTNWCPTSRNSCPQRWTMYP